MPHFAIEYSTNLETRINMTAFCGVIHDAALETGMFELGAVRVRAHPCDSYAIADLLPQNAFIHLTISVGAGRSEEARQQAGAHIWEAICAFLAPLYETPHFALTMEMREIDPATSWKKNGIHPRIRAQET